MSATVAVKRTYVRPLDVSEWYAPSDKLAIPAGSGDCTQGSANPFFGRRDNCRKIGCYAPGNHLLSQVNDGVRINAVCVSVCTTVTIDLQIDEPWRKPLLACLRASSNRVNQPVTNGYYNRRLGLRIEPGDRVHSSVCFLKPDTVRLIDPLSQKAFNSNRVEPTYRDSTGFKLQHYHLVSPIELLLPQEGLGGARQVYWAAT
jgi:hypothetical protein